MIKKRTINVYALRFLGFGGVLFILAGGLIGIFWSAYVWPFVFSYLICFIFVGSNFGVMHKIGAPKFNHFLKFFIISFAARFIAATAAITGYIWIVKSGQFFFTISFIISYICLSAIEIAFLKKILEDDTQN